MVTEHSVSRRGAIRSALAWAGGGAVALLGFARPAQAAPRYKAIRDGISAMKEARAELEAGRKVFGGHRVEAIKLLNAAIDECKAAIDYAETH
jgi:hypothetical protein